MKRGEIWTVAGGGDYTSKPRPVVIVQEDRFDVTDSITVCSLTSDTSEADLIRVVVEPSELNALTHESRIMVDKVTTVRRSRLGVRIGRLADTEMVLVNQALITFLGLATTRRR